MGLKYEAREAEGGWEVVAVADEPYAHENQVAFFADDGKVSAQVRAEQVAASMQNLYAHMVEGK